MNRLSERGRLGSRTLAHHAPVGQCVFSVITRIIIEDPSSQSRWSRLRIWVALKMQPLQRDLEPFDVEPRILLDLLRELVEEVAA
jgi:hypothetical protein